MHSGIRDLTFDHITIIQTEYVPRIAPLMAEK